MYINIKLLNLAFPEITERKWAPYILPAIYISDNGQEVPYNFHIQPLWFKLLISVNHNKSHELLNK